MVQSENMGCIPIWFLTNFQCRLMIASLCWVRMWGWRRRCRHRRCWTRIMLRWWCVAFDNSISLVNYVTSVIYRAIALTSHNNEAIDYTVVCMCFSSDIFIPFWSGLKCIKSVWFSAYDLNWIKSHISHSIRKNNTFLLFATLPPRFWIFDVFASTLSPSTEETNEEGDVTDW